MKKCEDFQAKLSRFQTGELSKQEKESLKDHLADCLECRRMLEFHRSLDAVLGVPVAVPSGLRSKLDAKLAAAPPLSFSARFLGDPLMKRILLSTSAVTAVAAAALLIVPGTAHASTPLTTFNSMRAALAKALRSGEVTFTTSVAPGGVISVNGTLDGQPFPPGIPVHVDAKVDGDTYHITVTANLAPSNYSSIKFGKDHSVLELSPKGKSDVREEVVLDPSTMAPLAWTTFKSENGGWKAASTCTYKPKATAKPSPDASMDVVAHITITVAKDQSAKMKVKKNG